MLMPAISTSHPRSLAPATNRARVGRRFRNPVQDARQLGGWALRRLRALTWWAPVEAFLIALRPVWCLPGTL